MIQSPLDRYLSQFPKLKIKKKVYTSPLNEWYKHSGINPLRYENIMPINSILGRNDVQGSVDAFNKGFSEGKMNALQSPEIKQSKLEHAKLGYLSKGNLLLTHKGDAYSFENFKNVVDGKEMLKSLHGNQPFTEELREIIIKGITPHIEMTVKANIEKDKNITPDKKEKAINDAVERRLQKLRENKNYFVERFNKIAKSPTQIIKGMTIDPYPVGVTLTDYFNYYNRNAIDLKDNRLKYGYRKIKSGFKPSYEKSNANVDNLFNFPSPRTLTTKADVVTPPKTKLSKSKSISKIPITHKEIDYTQPPKEPFKPDVPIKPLGELKMPKTTPLAPLPIQKPL